MKPLDYALEAISSGFKVVPVHYPKGQYECSCNRGASCSSIGKHPMPPRWVDIATNDPTTVVAWWHKYKVANIGIVTGAVSGIVVLDIDPRHGGEEALDELQAKYGKLPETPMVITGSGGSHYYFRHPGGTVKNSAGAIGRGIDIRGDGGFVVGAGSRHAGGGTYDWEASSGLDIPFAQMPTWLLELSVKPVYSVNQNIQSGDVIEGGRNVFLCSLAGAMRRRGCGYKPIFAALWFSNAEMCHPPLDRAEIESIAKSIMRYEK